MTPDQDASAIIPTAEQEGPVDPRPAWERIAYTWLAREVDAGQPVDPTALAGEVSVAPAFARDLVRVLRAHRQRDPELSELRGRLVRDQLTDAYLTRELAGGQPLDPAALAAQFGTTTTTTTTTVARQWLHTLRAGQQADRRLAGLRAEPTSHGRPTPEQLQALQATYAGGGRPSLEDRHPAEGALERIEQRYQTREAAGGQPLDPAAVAREVGVSEHYVRGTLVALRGGALTSAQRIEQLWRLWEAEGGQRLEFSQVARLVGVRDQCLDLAVKAAGGLDQDHGVFGGTLPAERSRLRGNTFPAPSIYRERRDLAEQAHQLAGQVGLRQAARRLGVHRDTLTAAFTQWDLPAPERRVGWQPSRFLTDRGEAERAFALAEQLGSVNAAAAELGTTWPSLRKAFGRHGLGMPARNPEAVRQRAIAAARQRTGRVATPSLDPVFAALNPGALPARERSLAELYQWVRRDEEYATLGASVVVELHSEATPASPPPGSGRSSAGPTAATGWAANAPAVPSVAKPSVPTTLADPSSPRSGRWPPMLANLGWPTGRTASSGSTRRRWVMSRLSAVPVRALPTQALRADQGMGRSPTGRRPGPSQPVTRGLVSKP